MSRGESELEIFEDIFGLQVRQPSEIDDSDSFSEELRNVVLPKLSKADIKMMKQRLKGGGKLGVIMRESDYRFPFSEEVLNEVASIKSGSANVLNFVASVVFYSYIAWLCDGERKGVRVLVHALLSLHRQVETAHKILRHIFVVVVESEAIVEVRHEFVELVKRSRCEDLATKVWIELEKRLDTNEMCRFITDLTDAIVLHEGWEFGDENIEKILVASKELILQVNSIVFRFFSSDIGLTQKNWEMLLEWLFAALLERMRKMPPLELDMCGEAPPRYTMLCAPKTYMYFAEVDTLPDGFDPSTSVEFPAPVDLAKTFDGEVQRCIFLIKNVVMVNDARVEVVLRELFKWAESLSKDPYYYSALSVIMCVSSDESGRPSSWSSVKSSVLELFMHPVVFDPRVSLWSDGPAFKFVNTFRMVCLDCIMCGSADIVNKFLGNFLAPMPLVLAETLFRMSNMSSLLASKIESDTRVIKTLITLAMFYQQLEINLKEDQKDIRTARVSMFVLLAHLFSDPKTLRLFFDDILFANSFLSFVFEASLRPFVLQSLSTYISLVELKKATFLPPILLGIINIVDLHLPGQKQLMLLYDLVACLNESFAYHQSGVDQFGDFCSMLCQCMAKLSSDSLSRRVFDVSVSFFALMSPYFTITPLEINALIFGLTSFNDPEFLTSLYSKFISLLAGQPVTSLTPTFIVRQPQVLKLFIQALFDTPMLKDMLKFISDLCKYSPRNLLACAKSDLELFVIRYLEKAKQTETLSNDVMQMLLEIYCLLSLPYSSLQSVLRYVSLMAPRDDGYISKYQNLFISNMNQIAVNSSNEPLNSMALTGCDIDFVANPKFQQINEWFVFTFWLYLEPNKSTYRPRICYFEFDSGMMIGVFVSNNSLLMFNVDGEIETTGIICDNIEPHMWHFIAVLFQVSPRRIYVHYTIDCSARSMLSFPALSRPLDFSKATFHIGGYCQETADIPSRLGALGVFGELRAADLISIFELGPRNNENPPVPAIIYISDYSERLTKGQGSLVEPVGFMNVLISQCGVGALLPLFTQSECKLSDGSDFCIELDSVLTLLANILMYSLESQALFYQNNGFSIIAHLLQEHWTKNFTMKLYLQFFQMLVTIQSELLQQQLFDEVMTNFSFIMALPASLHLRIVKHWSQSLFTSFLPIAKKFTSFEDMMTIIRLFYWYRPVESMFVKYQEVRPPDLDVKKCRGYLFSVLWGYVSDEFTDAKFQCLVSHAIGCNEKQQVQEILAFIIRILGEKSQFVGFDIQNEAFEHMIHFYIRYPSEPIRIQVLELLITAHQVKLLSDAFVEKQLDRILLHLPQQCVTETLFDWIEGVLAVEPRLFSLCCFLAIQLKNYNFVGNIKPSAIFTASALWAIWPLALCISSPVEHQNHIMRFLIDSCGDSLCNLYTQVEILMELVPNSSKALESIFFRVLCEKYSESLPASYQGIREFIAVCKRIIFFGCSGDCSVFSCSGGAQQAAFDFLEFLDAFRSKQISERQTSFGMQFDHNGKWIHHDLAKLCLQVLESPWCQKLSNFKLLLAAFLIRDGEDIEGIRSIIDGLESEDTFLSTQLVNYYLVLRGQKPIFQTPGNYNPLVDQAKFAFIVTQLKNEFYAECLSSMFAAFHSFKDKMAHDVDPAHIDVSDMIVQSTEQMKTFLRRQKGQNAINRVSWHKLWSSLSIVRGPWFNPEKSEQRKWVRDISACFGLAPVKMRQATSTIDTELDDPQPLDNGIFSYSCNIIDLKARQPAVISFDETSFRITMGKKQFNILYRSLQCVFRRQHNGIQLFTQLGRTFLVEFDEATQASRVLSFLFQKCSTFVQLFQQVSDQTTYMKQLRFTASWRLGHISNYEYLLMINHVAGRSFNDVIQYPVMPWVLQDFESEIDVNNVDPSLLRDFTVKPADDPLPHYAVISYLHAIEPFASLETDTITEDMFSLDGYLSFAQKDKKISLELVPEFYSMPEIFMSPSFALPMWAQSPFDFVYCHRKVLESDAVSNQLHIWIDNVFGPTCQPFHCFDGPHPERILSSPQPAGQLVEHVLECPSGIFCAVVIVAEKQNVFHFWCYEMSGQISDLIINVKRAASPSMTTSTSISDLFANVTTRETGSPGSRRSAWPRIRSHSVLSRLAAGDLPEEDVLPKSTRKNLKPPEPLFHIVTNQKSVLMVSKTGPVVLDLVSGKVTTFNIGDGRVNDVSVDGIWAVFGMENATLVLVRNYKSVYTIRLFREAVTACAVSSVFNLVVGGTKDSALILCSTVTRSLIKVVNIEANDEVLVPKKIMITPSWGFIVAYCTSIVAGTLKHYILVYTVNGLFLHRTEIGVAIDYWYSWQSNKGFDYMIFASDTGQVYFSEVYYLNQNHLNLLTCRHVIAAYMSTSTSTLVVVTKHGQVKFLPIVMN